MATKSSKLLWTSPMATTDSEGPAGTFAGPAQATAVDTRTKTKKMQRCWGETQTGARTITLPPMGKQQTLAKRLSSAGHPVLRCIVGCHSCRSTYPEIGACAKVVGQTGRSPEGKSILTAPGWPIRFRRGG